MSDYLEVEGILDLGYGVVAKKVMQDVNLSIEAKGIYAYLCTYAGNGKVAFPRVDLIRHQLGVGKDRYYKHRAMLVDAGYLSIRQNIEKGKFKNNIFTLNMIIEKRDKNVEKIEQSTTNKDTSNTETSDSDSNNNNLKSNNLNNNNLVKSDGKTKKDTKKESQAGKQKTLLNVDNNNYTAVRDNFQEQIKYKDFEHMANNNGFSENLRIEKKKDLQLVESVVDAYVNIYFSNNPIIRIGKEEKAKEVVMGMFAKLTDEHIGNIIKKLRSNTKKITYKNNYLVTLMYMEVLEFGTNNIAY